MIQMSPSDVWHRRSLLPSMLGLRVANSFHPQMWTVKVHGISALERFQDDAVLRSALRKCAQFWPNRRCWNDQCLRSLMRVHHRIRVTNFRPTAAKAIIDRFSPEDGRVLDFCAGYGGRLLGAMSLRRRYIGIEPARAQIRGLRRLHRAVEALAPGTAELHHACAEDLLPTLPSRSVDLVFSSPPYFNLERYSNERTQSFRRYPTYPMWCESFLAVVIQEARRVLRPDGHFVVNVADSISGPVATDTLRLAGKQFRLVDRLRLTMAAPPSSRAAGRLYRFEPVYVFRVRH